MKYGDSITIWANQETEDDTAFELEIAAVMEDFEPYLVHNYQLTDYNSALVILLSQELYEEEIEMRIYNIFSNIHFNK